MRPSSIEIRARAAEFARKWRTARGEDPEKQKFWREFFEVFKTTREDGATSSLPAPESFAPETSAGTVQLGPDQERAMERITRWLNGDDQKWSFTLAGYAGTGKTFLISHIVETLAKKAVCLAPTGKAASVLSRKLQDRNVRTIHSALYKPISLDISQLMLLEGELEKAPAGTSERKRLEEQVAEECARLTATNISFGEKKFTNMYRDKLVIVDEASMASEQMRADLEKTGGKILFVGDNGQLPPVQGRSWFIDERPDAMLNEVHRQALDNPIIRCSMLIREGQTIAQLAESHGRTHDLQFYARQEFKFPGIYKEAHQIICGTNSVRVNVNRYLRKLHGYESPDPVAGDKLICLKNNVIEGEDGPQYIYNGAIVEVLEAPEPRDPPSANFATIAIHYDGAIFVVPYYTFHTRDTYRSADDPSSYLLPREVLWGVNEFDYGYAITAHKAQGSEWDKVLLLDDRMRVLDAEFRKRWLYTAFTRASKQLVVAS